MEGKGGMLDFYADWCVECIRMEKNTFTDAGVQEQLGHLLLLQADVTANDEIDQELMKAFSIIGPRPSCFSTGRVRKCVATVWSDIFRLKSFCLI